MPKIGIQELQSNAAWVKFAEHWIHQDFDLSVLVEFIADARDYSRNNATSLGEVLRSFTSWVAHVNDVPEAIIASRYFLKVDSQGTASCTIPSSELEAIAGRDEQRKRAEAALLDVKTRQMQAREARERRQSYVRRLEMAKQVVTNLRSELAKVEEELDREVYPVHQGVIGLAPGHIAQIYSKKAGLLAAIDDNGNRLKPYLDHIAAIDAEIEEILKPIKDRVASA